MLIKEEHMMVPLKTALLEMEKEIRRTYIYIYIYTSYIFPCTSHDAFPVNVLFVLVFSCTNQIHVVVFLLNGGSIPRSIHIPLNPSIFHVPFETLVLL